MKEFFLKVLQPGDMLVYSSNGIFGWLIKKKTYSHYTHVAIYIGNGKQREFREGVGAQEVPLNIRNLVMIRRPKGLWNREKSDEFWEEIKDQTYDYLGLFFSFVAVRQGRKNNSMFCSEYVARDYGITLEGEPLFSEDVDADGVSPADCVRSSRAKLLWKRRDL